MVDRVSDSAGEYIFPSSDDEARRLELQARLYGGLGFLEAALAARPREILDVGCGSGHVTRRLAADLPAARITGLDLDEARIAYARARAGADNLRYERGDLTALPFEDGRFDLTFCRFVLGHQTDPIAALREMARVTRPGGQVVAYDLIHEGIWFSPPKPALEQILATTIAVLRERGAEPNQGLHLPVGLRRAGLQEVREEVIPHHASSEEPLFDAYRSNWLATVDSLAEAFGERLAEGLVEAARRELTPATDAQFMLEITVLAQGTRGGA